MLGHLLAFQTLSIALPCLHSEISKQHPWKFATFENDREDANLWILFSKGSLLRLVALYKFFYTHHLSVIQKNSVVCCYFCLPEASANMSTDNRRILIRCAHLKQPKTKLLWLDTKSTRNRLRKYQKDQPRSVVVIV